MTRIRRSAISTDRPALGISSCLLGENVRYDGQLRRDEWIVGTLARHVNLIPLCPEMAIGMGMPRPPIRLMARSDGVHAEGEAAPELDVTVALREYGARMTEEVITISGYIFKARSPSCGLRNVNLFRLGNETPRLEGTGLYAAEWQARRPELPMEEEGGLGNPERRDSFIERTFALQRWQRAMARGITTRRLVDFHATHRWHLLNRGTPVLRALERLAAQAKVGDIDSASAAYLCAFMDALRPPATRTGHSRVFATLVKQLPRSLSKTDRTELSEALRRYRAGEVPRSVPVTLLVHHLRRAGNSDVAESPYLQPSPGEWALRGD
jgi:uncharacterized protein YbbK (DUF523 family)/uncharacterized protein YbgA (DUF1722 family)